MAKTKRSLLPTDYKWTVSSRKSVSEAQSNSSNNSRTANSESEPRADDTQNNATTSYKSLSWISSCRHQPTKNAPDFRGLKYKTISKDNTADENMQRSASLAYLGSRLTSCHNTNLKVKPVKATSPSRADLDTISTSILKESDQAPPSIRRTITIEPTPEYQQFYNTIRREIDRQRLEYHYVAKDDLASDSFTCSSPNSITKATRSKPRPRSRRKGPLDMDTRIKTTFKRKFKLSYNHVNQS
ncbi:hypothetical protein FHL15_009315 [Xylaria flabelliformis]|uniref:Uncharacterized protein n=1 Tax=Xylaria flabelliformis TaxID=2512241 RepID=A0A553HP41_9PEZI|nr:hypothetical protein FHL15_009315 [Xylaria flabelliformis]